MAQRPGEHCKDFQEATQHLHVLALNLMMVDHGGDVVEEMNMDGTGVIVNNNNNKKKWESTAANVHKTDNKEIRVGSHVDDENCNFS